MEKIYLWLPRIFGCHCRSDRSFFYKGRQFPLCARCTGELVGMIFGVFMLIFWKPSILLSVLILIPLIVDGFVQRLTSYESTNLKRVITGFLFGIGIMSLFVQSTIAAFEFGFNWGLEMFS